jgi:hypothetical protein
MKIADYRYGVEKREQKSRGDGNVLLFTGLK